MNSTGLHADGPEPQPIGRIDRFIGEYRFLSNFYPAASSDNAGRVYPSVEHAYQAAKANSEAERSHIAESRTPKKAKHRGSKLVPTAGWENRKRDIMRELLLKKFSPGSELAGRLVATDDAELIEGNLWGDIFWGVCNGVGENHLGRLLMEIRALLHGLPPATDPDAR